jgi:hypothetical protein
MGRANPKPRATPAPRDAPLDYISDPNFVAMRYRKSFVVPKPGGGHQRVFVTQIPPQSP